MLSEEQRAEGEQLVRELLILIGEDPDRDGLLETPRRVVKSWEDLYQGYSQECQEHCKVFEQKCDQMVMLRGLKYYSMCEHHMLPFYGVCHVAYIPAENRVLGVSKIARMIEVFSRRLQLQERLTAQIAEGIQETISPCGVAVYMDGKHLCMMQRGVEQQNATMRTHKLLGVFLDNSSARAELLSLMGLKGV